MVALRPFFGRPRSSPKDRPADPGWGLWLGPAILAALGLLCGLAPGRGRATLVAPMALAVAGAAMPSVHLALWHGIGAPLAAQPRHLRARRRCSTWRSTASATALPRAEPALPRTEGWYDARARRARRLAAGVTGAVQNGRMTSYLRTTFLALGLLIWGALLVGRRALAALRARRRADRLGDRRRSSSPRSSWCCARARG